MASSIVDSVASMAKLVDKLQNLHNETMPLLRPGRHQRLEEGSVSILQFLVEPEDHFYLIDIHVLGEAAFKTKGSTTSITSQDCALQGILKYLSIPKVCFDVRNDSDALYFRYGIALEGVQDVQLMENAARPVGSKKFLNGLRKCIESHAPLTEQEKQQWKAVKEAGIKLLISKNGGSFQVCNA